MENRSNMRPEVKAEVDPVIASSVSSSEKVFHFAPTRVENVVEPVPPERRDWGAAIELVKEASEAVRLAEERTQSAEAYSKQAATYYKEQLKAAEIKTLNAERRAEVALLRAVEAESWLARFHDAIIQGFGHHAISDLKNDN